MTAPTVNLGGRLWHLRYDINALAELEDALRKPLGKIGMSLKRGEMGMRETRALVWAGMLHEDEDLTIKQVGVWITEAGFQKNTATRDDLMAKVFEALSAAFPGAETDGDSKN